MTFAREWNVQTQGLTNAFSPTLAERGFTSDSMCALHLLWKTSLPDVPTPSFSLIHTELSGASSKGKTRCEPPIIGLFLLLSPLDCCKWFTALGMCTCDPLQITFKNV